MISRNSSIAALRLSVVLALGALAACSKPAPPPPVDDTTNGRSGNTSLS